MKKLQRGLAPACLSQFTHGANDWDDVSSADKTQIWLELDAMQGQRCAYCEGSIGEGHRHIEHFRQKGRDPTLTFVWNNLFGSCNREESCGKYKDKCKVYPPAVLIKPDIEDPEHYFVFDPHGGISPRTGLNTADSKRAQETIRIFNLNGSLRGIRRNQLKRHAKIAKEWAELAGSGDDPELMALILQEIEQELAATAHLPFSTAIKHVLTRQC